MIIFFDLILFKIKLVLSVEPSFTTIIVAIFFTSLIIELIVFSSLYTGMITATFLNFSRVKFLQHSYFFLIFFPKFYLPHMG